MIMRDMEIPEIKSWLYIVNAVGTAIIAVYLGFRRKHDKNAERINALQESFSTLESEMKDKISGIGATQQVQDTRLATLEASNKTQTEVLYEILRSNGKLEGRMIGVGNSLEMLIKHNMGEKK